MEGREPPPKASEFNFNFPLDTRKFWGTPVAKGFYKFFFWTTLALFTVNGTNCYLTRNQTHFLGFKIALTPEEGAEKIALNEKQAFIRSLGIGLDFASKNLTKYDSEVEDVRLDDRIMHVVGTDKHYANKDGI